MTHYKRYLLIFLASIIAFITPIAHAEDVSFDIYHGDVQVYIDKSGDVYFRQVYSYDVDYMNGALISVLRSGHDVLDYKAGIVDAETSTPIYFKESDSEDSETFQMTNNGDQMDFKLFYPSEDDTVHFFVEYTLNDVIENYKDTAVFNWKIIGTGIDEDLDVTGKIFLPDRVKENEHFRVWGHGSPSGQVHPITDDEGSYVSVEVPDNPSHTFVEVNTLFPARMTQDNPNYIDENRLDELTKQEDARVLADKEKFEKSKGIAKNVSLIFSVIGPLFLLFSVKSYKKTKNKINPNPAHVPEHIYNPPEDLKPAIVGYTYAREGMTSSSGDLSVTLLDFAQRGLITIEEVDRSWGRKTVRITPNKGTVDNLEPFEREAYEFIQPIEGDSILLSDINQLMKKNHSYKEQQVNHIEIFKDLVEEKGKALRGKQKVSPIVLLIISIIFIVISSIGMFVVADIFSTLNLWWPYIVGYMIIMGGLAIYHCIQVFQNPLLSYEDDKKRREWKAFAKMLKDIGQMDMRQIAELPLWEEYLIYAVAFGSAKKVIKAMNEQFDVSEFDSLMLPRGFYLDNGAMFTSFDSAVTESVSGSSFGSSGYAGDNIGGGGGGFSGGSSGGGGGGGAGGF